MIKKLLIWLDRLFYKPRSYDHYGEIDPVTGHITDKED
jgi:hypothetical protein